MARIHLKTRSDLFWKTQLSFYFNLFWKSQKIDRTLLAGISSNCFCSWKFEGSNLPKEARSQIWDGDLNIWNNKSHLSLYLINSISIFFRYLDVQKNTYARPNGFYPRDYLHSKCNTVFLSFCWPLLLTILSWEDCRSGALARSLQSVFSLEMSTIGPPKFQTNLVYIWMEIVPAVTHIWSSIRVQSLFASDVYVSLEG